MHLPQRAGLQAHHHRMLGRPSGGLLPATPRRHHRSSRANNRQLSLLPPARAVEVEVKTALKPLAPEQRRDATSNSRHHHHHQPLPAAAATHRSSSSQQRPQASSNGHQPQPHVPRPGDLVLPAVDASPALSVLVHQPTYDVVIQYTPAGRLLEPARRIWAHVGHSGWQHTMDVELFRDEAQPGVWSGVYEVPASQLAEPRHIDVQMVFKGEMPEGHEVYDNNEGRNWGVVAEVAHEQGLVLPRVVSGAAVSALLLLLSVLQLNGLLTTHQEQTLRLLAWQHDTRLMRAWEHVRHWGDLASAAGQLLSRTLFAARPGVNIVHIASEMVPVAKVGGLGDVVTSLSKAHQRDGQLVEVVLPKYDVAQYESIQGLRELTTFDVAWDSTSVPTRAWCGVVEGLPVYFLEPLQPAAFFWRGRMYGEPDDAERFMFFSRAALEFLVATGRQPDVLHLHDWQSAAVAPLLVHEYRARGLKRLKTVLTIHNIAFQGWMTPDCLSKVGLDPASLAHPHLMLDDCRPGFRPDQQDVSLMRGGVVYADRVTTVSHSYSKEVLCHEYGFGLEGVLQRHAGKFRGVLNGIDNEVWDPACDLHLPLGGHFSASEPANKEVCKAALLQQLGLPYTNPADTPDGVGRPLMVIISRLTQQKGLPLMLHGIQVALQQGAQVVVLGSASEAEVQQTFERMAGEHGSGPDARFVLRYDEGLAHRLYAAADLILIPSFFEPCGLTQLIGLRFGTIPVVNATGGLADTVRDVADGDVPEADRNGFVFRGREAHHVEAALLRALNAYRGGHAWWRGELLPRVMRQDWSWSRSAHDYLDIYHSL